MDDLTEKWKNLSLSEREGPGLSLREEKAMTEYILAAKFLTKRALNFNIIYIYIYMYVCIYMHV